jgi:hypothetical protein
LFSDKKESIPLIRSKLTILYYDFSCARKEGKESSKVKEGLSPRKIVRKEAEREGSAKEEEGLC